MKRNAQQPYIAIEGVIGVGKTTLARLLQPQMHNTLMLEAFDENPFLSDFYEDRDRYAFQTQIFFLLSRYRQQQNISQQLQQHAILSDYFFEKDKLFAHLNIKGQDELEMYDRLYAALSERVPQADLVIYLRAETDTLMARIAMRDRPYERHMDRAYILALRQQYEALFANYEATPLLIIESDEIDFVRNPEDLHDIAHRIRAALDGVRQPTLPDIATTVPRPSWSLIDKSTASEQSTDAAQHSQANWQALGDYLALAEAVGQIGGALAQHPPISPNGASELLRNSLQDAAQAINILAKRIDVHVGK